MDIEAFFEREGADVNSWVGIDGLPDRDRVSVLEFLPVAQSVIVFGKAVPAPAYRMPPREKTREMLRIAGELDNTAQRFAGLLSAEHIPACIIPLYFPVRIVDGRVQGIVRLKQIAAAGGLGEIGENTLLLNRRFGPRLLLAGVVTAEPAPASDTTAPLSLCTGCGACARACPEGAIGPDGIDAFRCRNVGAWVPPALVPAAKWLLGQQVLLRNLAPLAPLVARTATIRCSLCVTGCPAFQGAANPVKSPPDPV